MTKITKENASKFIEEAKLDNAQRARDTKEYEVMLLDFLNEQFKEEN